MLNLIHIVSNTTVSLFRPHRVLIGLIKIHVKEGQFYITIIIASWNEFSSLKSYYNLLIVWMPCDLFRYAGTFLIRALHITIRKIQGQIKCGRSLSTKRNQRRAMRLPCLQLLHFTTIKARKHCSTEYFYILFAKLFVWTFGNSVQCEQYFVQSVLQEFLRTTSFLYSAALCRWNHGNGLEEYRLTVKQFIDLCAVLLLLPANMERKRRP